MKVHHPLIIEVTRGRFVESQHQVMISVMDDRAMPVAFWGNPEYATMPRSAIKFLQAIPLLETGAFDAFKLEEKCLSFACASHHGERQHLLLAHDWMTKLGLTEANLCCGGHWPPHEATAHDMIRKGIKPTPIVNNCSGKHLGLLTTAMAKREKPEGYEAFEHPVQVRIRRVLTEMMKLDHEKLPWGIDGCGIPTYANTLQAMATGMASMVSHRQSSERRKSSERILQAVQKHAFFMGGSEDFSSRMNSFLAGKALVKTGAEGVFCGVIPEKGWGFSLKAIDGGKRAAEVACAFLLKQLGVMTDEQFENQKVLTHPPVRNWKALEVGEVRVKETP